MSHTLANAFSSELFIFIFETIIIIIIIYLFLPSLLLIFDTSPAVMGISLYRTPPYVDVVIQLSPSSAILVFPRISRSPRKTHAN